MFFVWHLRKENVLKLVAIGDRGSGKTSLIHRFMTGNFIPHLDSTIGAAIYNKEMHFKNKGPVKLEIWDTSGIQGFNTMQNHYYKAANVILLVFSFTEESLATPQLWYDKISATNPKALFVLVGTMCDLKNGNTKLDTDIQNFISNRDLILYMETSSKLDKNVQDLFQSIVDSEVVNESL